MSTDGELLVTRRQLCAIYDRSDWTIFRWATGCPGERRQPRRPMLYDLVAVGGLAL